MPGTRLSTTSRGAMAVAEVTGRRPLTSPQSMDQFRESPLSPQPPCRHGVDGYHVCMQYRVSTVDPRTMTEGWVDGWAQAWSRP
jgi:hypothetical protein